jgi:hypothetical protein
MAYELQLPKDITQREQSVNTLLNTSRTSRRISEVNWWIAHHYLQGARNFDMVDFEKGRVDVSYFNDRGALEFRYDDVVRKFQNQVGRLMQIDLSPAVSKKSIGLEDLRKASIAQAVLSYVLGPREIDALAEMSFGPLTKYGVVGLAVWMDSNDPHDIGIEVVMPWELLPLPPSVIETGDVRGIARERTVPVDWLKELGDTPGKGAAVWTEMEKKMVGAGNIPTGSDTRFMTFQETLSPQSLSTKEYKNMAGSASGKKNELEVEVTQFQEIWLKDSSGFLKDYYMYAGGRELFHKDWSKARLPMPIAVVHDIDTGGFWGRSFVSLQLPLNMELENSIGKMFQNVEDVDAYGMVAMPTTMGAELDNIRASQGVRFLMYEPDYTVPNLKPEGLPVAKFGDQAVKAINAGLALSDKMALQPTEMLGGGAPGRVDSQSGLGFLYEVSNVPLTPTSRSINRAVSDCYRAILKLVKLTWTGADVVGITMLDDALAGIVLDDKAGTMNLTKNAVPDPSEVEITVKSMIPRSREQEKAELKDALALGAIDIMEYRIEVRKRGLGVPVGNEAEWQNYRRAMMENLILFGDGQTPGTVTVDEDDMHPVHIRVLQAFRARPEYYAASQAIRDKFKKHYDAHLQGLGTLPEGAPYPEDAAELSQMPMLPEAQQALAI